VALSIRKKVGTNFADKWRSLGRTEATEFFFNRIHHKKKKGGNVNAFEKISWATHLEELDAIDAQSYTGRINVSYKEMELIDKANPSC
jgi:hypothetical protein